jgi:hypothetical protein
MNRIKKLLIASAAALTVLCAGCAGGYYGGAPYGGSYYGDYGTGYGYGGPYYGDYGPSYGYGGPYYGNYGPSYGYGGVIVGGYRNGHADRRYYGRYASNRTYAAGRRSGGSRSTQRRSSAPHSAHANNRL